MLFEKKGKISEKQQTPFHPLFKKICYAGKRRGAFWARPFGKLKLDPYGKEALPRCPPLPALLIIMLPAAPKDGVPGGLGFFSFLPFCWLRFFWPYGKEEERNSPFPTRPRSPLFPSLRPFRLLPLFPLPFNRNLPGPPLFLPFP